MSWYDPAEGSLPSTKKAKSLKRASSPTSIGEVIAADQVHKAAAEQSLAVGISTVNNILQCLFLHSAHCCFAIFPQNAKAYCDASRHEYELLKRTAAEKGSTLQFAIPTDVWEKGGERRQQLL